MRARRPPGAPGRASAPVDLVEDPVGAQASARQERASAPVDLVEDLVGAQASGRASAPVDLVEHLVRTRLGKEVSDAPRNVSCPVDKYPDDLTGLRHQN
ncbi:hypothetical protein [Myxococcus llanfairpwllgwyngyllgogerychwyrndrobwllllantysiliogogogochensis]|uniref:hypothetical protein n=1 Tax=Myxococcus llanfairpwllgwyngyllgogerychwyrndrobwllllantysiliogogogochensis TaxID=2590453 RepID=UPI0015F0DC42|nr:hypothetical protein [Myxococcus llanfairpwllgwyngyllgogerychwyrndrobwllllantysiliogogogochensis]